MGKVHKHPRAEVLVGGCFAKFDVCGHDESPFNLFSCFSQSVVEAGFVDPDALSALGAGGYVKLQEASAHVREEPNISAGRKHNRLVALKCRLHGHWPDLVNGLVVQLIYVDHGILLSTIATLCVHIIYVYSKFG